MGRRQGFDLPALIACLGFCASFALAEGDSAAFQIEPPKADFKLEKIYEWDNAAIDLVDIQGLTFGSGAFYISNMTRVYSFDKFDFGKPAKNSVWLHSLQLKLSGGYYRHLGGMECFNDTLYIAVTGKRHPFAKTRDNPPSPIVLVLDKDLEFVKFGYFPRETQNGAGWLSVNPADGHIWSSYPYGTLHAYDRNFKNGDTLKVVKSLRAKFLHEGELKEPITEFVNQGATFSKTGKLFYVMDHKTLSDSAAKFLGVHVFELGDSLATEIPVRGYNNYGEEVDFIGFRYNAGDSGGRLWEAEDVELVETERGVELYWLQLLNLNSPLIRVLKYSVSPSALQGSD